MTVVKNKFVFEMSGLIGARFLDASKFLQTGICCTEICQRKQISCARSVPHPKGCGFSQTLRHQISYGFTAKISRKVRSPEYTEDEKTAEMELKWYNKSEALKNMEKDSPLDKIHKALSLRDYLFLKKAISKN